MEQSRSIADDYRPKRPRSVTLTDGAFTLLRRCIYKGAIRFHSRLVGNESYGARTRSSLSDERAKNVNETLNVLLSFIFFFNFIPIIKMRVSLSILLVAIATTIAEESWSSRDDDKQKTTNRAGDVRCAIDSTFGHKLI